MYTHKLFARFFFKTRSLSRLTLRSPRICFAFRLPVKSAKFFDSGAIANPLRTVHTFSISRPSPPFSSTLAATLTSTDFFRALQKSRIVSIRIRHGTPDGINIFVGNGGYRQVEGVIASRRLRNSIFRRRGEGFCFQEKRKGTLFTLQFIFARNLHNCFTLYRGTHIRLQQQQKQTT